jgi:hypothetical protein
MHKHRWRSATIRLLIERCLSSTRKGKEAQPNLPLRLVRLDEAAEVHYRCATASPSAADLVQQGFSVYPQGVRFWSICALTCRRS